MIRPALLRSALVVSALCAALACGSDDGGPADEGGAPRAVRLLVDPDTVLLNSGEIELLGVYALDSAGEGVVLENLQVTSSDTSVVKITNTSTMEAMQVEDTATITVQANGFTVKVPVTVGIIPWVIQLNDRSITLASGGTKQLAPTVYDRMGNTVTPDHFVWTGDNPAVYTVSSTGLVTSVGPEGYGHLTLTVRQLSQRLGVYVGALPAADLLSNDNTGAAPFAVAIAPTGRTVLALGTGSILVAGQLPSRTFPDTVHLSAVGPSDVVVDAAGTTAYAALPNGVDVADIAADSITRHIPLPHAFSLALSSDGARLFVGTDAKIYTVNTATGAVIDSVAFPRALDLSIHPTLPRLYAISSHQLSELDQATLDVLRTFDDALGEGRGLAVAPNGSRLYYTDESNDVYSRDLGNGQIVERTGLQGCFGVVPVGSYVAVSCEGVIYFVDGASMIPLKWVEYAAPWKRPAASADGTVIVPSFSGTVAFIK
jgi:DNA-binding beta-propeller fold protein YncE